MPIVIPPTVVTRTGTWRVVALPVVHAGYDTLVPPVYGGAMYPSTSVAGTSTWTYPPSPSIYLDGAGAPTADEDLPTGFDPDGDTPGSTPYTWQIGASIMGGASIAGSISYTLAALALNASYAGPGPVPDPVVIAEQVHAGLTRLELLGLAGSTTVATVNLANSNPTTGFNPGFMVGGADLHGTYTAQSYWWRVPTVDACGNPLDGAPYVLTSDDPGDPWVRLDPDDPTAHPTPVVLTVTPNHGVIAGGTAVTITGSGFGADATVTFDGDDATDIIVVSATTITCTTPAHAGGAADIVVTNVDGVHS